MPTLNNVDIAFNARITSLKSLSQIFNLIELTLVYCENLATDGIESQGHSLE